MTSANPEFGTTRARRLNQSTVCAVLQSNLIAIKFDTAEALPVSGEKQNSSGNLEILPGIGKRKFSGKHEIIPGPVEEKSGIKRKTISKRLCEGWLLIAQKKFFALFCPIDEQ